MPKTVYVQEPDHADNLPINSRPMALWHRKHTSLQLVSCILYVSTCWYVSCHSAFDERIQMQIQFSYSATACHSCHSKK